MRCVHIKIKYSVPYKLYMTARDNIFPHFLFILYHHHAHHWCFLCLCSLIPTILVPNVKTMKVYCTMAMIKLKPQLSQWQKWQQLTLPQTPAGERTPKRAAVVFGYCEM